MLCHCTALGLLLALMRGSAVCRWWGKAMQAERRHWAESRRVPTAPPCWRPASHPHQQSSIFAFPEGAVLSDIAEPASALLSASGTPYWDHFGALPQVQACPLLTIGPPTMPGGLLGLYPRLLLETPHLYQGFGSWLGCRPHTALQWHIHTGCLSNVPQSQEGASVGEEVAGEA